MKLVPKGVKYDLLLEAEVSLAGQKKFEKEYQAATGVLVKPKNPVHYQSQKNKWGRELRIYFNDPGMAVALEALGYHVEFPRQGYKAGEYRYRVNDNNLWWLLVNSSGMRLGVN